MKSSEIKKMMIDSLDAGSDTSGIPGQLENVGVEFGFSSDFNEKVSAKIFSGRVVMLTRQTELLRYINSQFYRVALTGVAAIIILLISIFMTEGSLSFNSFLGLSDNYDESIISLLTGN